MNSNEVREKFLKFFEKRGHVVLPSASLVTNDDAVNTNATLFNTAGMQPFVPYLMGEAHPSGKRLVNIQKCLRTVDLDEVGDNTHLTFFEMMGNWSLGDYFKEDAIKWSYEFLTSKEEGLGLDINRLYFTVFGGSEKIPKDIEAVEIWKSFGVKEDRIYFKSSKSNWWSAGPNSPAGPSTEMFYDVTGNLGDMDQIEFEKAEDEQNVVEIWNDVFMVYKQENNLVVDELKQKNVDTGSGLERVTMALQNVNNIYDTDLFLPIIGKIKELSKNSDVKAQRIVADHIRTATFLIADGVVPSNTDRGYVLRRILRRAVRYADVLGLPVNSLIEIVEVVKEKYKEPYPYILEFSILIKTEIAKEEKKFRETLENGLKEFERGEDPFILATTYGFPIELTEELANEKGIKIDREDFNKKMEEHKKLSQTASAGMFKGGLANHEEKTIKLHTAHHLLLAALQEVLGKEVKQRGSNITEERLRMDFKFDRKLTDEEKSKVEDLVNGWIAQGLPVTRHEMPLADAEKLGAEMEFGAKYPDIVSVYLIQAPPQPLPKGEGLAPSPLGKAGDGAFVSAEFCGGPHVTNTNELGHFKIQKEEASSQGVRRIKAVLE